MDLPKLPRALKKVEANLTPKIIKKLEDNFQCGFICEIKVDNRNFSQHQKNRLEKGANGRYTIKIPDSALGKVSVDVHSFYKTTALAVILWKKNKHLEVYDYKTKTTTYIKW